MKMIYQKIYVTTLFELQTQLDLYYIPHKWFWEQELWSGSGFWVKTYNLEVVRSNPGSDYCMDNCSQIFMV